MTAETTIRQAKPIQPPYRVQITPQSAGAPNLWRCVIEQQGSGLSDSVICTLEIGPKTSGVRGFVVRSKDAQTNLFRMETIIVPQNSEPFKRLPHETVTQLQGKHVAIIGLGSGGGEIALNLACAGVIHFSFFDPDRLHEENYIRHILNRRDLGRTKLKGLKSDFRNRNLNVTVDEYFYNILVFANEFRETLSEAAPDLLICATDSRDSRRLINLCGVKLGIPTIVAGTLHGGKVGEVLLVLPGATSCYECIREQLGAVLEATDVDGRETNPYLGGDPTEVPSSAQRFDIAFVAGLVTRVALQVLDPDRYPSLPANYLVWGREASTEFGSPFNFALPLTVNFAQMRKLDKCIICGQGVELDGLDIEQKYGDILAGFNSVQE